MKPFRQSLAILILYLCLGLANAAAQTNEFTYQGKLSDSGTPSATYDFEFRLCASESDCPTPLQIKERLGVTVTNGIFTVKLDFEAAHFTGADRFLLISVRRNSGESWTPLNPQQKITSSPYSIKSEKATSANSLVCNLCVTDAQIQSIDGSKVTGTVANATTANNVSGVVGIANGGTGSSTQNFVDLSTNQTSIGGDKTFTGVLSGNIVNATTQYNIAGLRMLSANGSYNEIITGNFPASNTFVGGSAGLNTTPDPSPSGFFGKLNTFFGAGAGQANTTGYLNSFFGFKAGASNTTATGNAFFGQSAGSRSTGAANSFFGRLSGNNNLGGNSNTAVGENADFTTNNATGSFNALLGSNTRVAANTSSQTAIGSYSRTDAANSTAIGYGAYVTQSHSLVLGSINGLNNCAPPFCDSVKVGIGTTAPSERLHVVGNGLFTGNFTTGGTLAGNIVNAATQYNINGQRVLSNAGANNLFAGVGAGVVNLGGENAFFGFNAGNKNNLGGENSFFGFRAGFNNVDGGANSFFGYAAGHNIRNQIGNTFVGDITGLNTGIDDDNNNASGNTFIGAVAGQSNRSGARNTLLGYFADVGSINLVNATAIGANARVSQSDSLVLGDSAIRVGIGTSAPDTTLHLRKDAPNALGPVLTLTNGGGNGAAAIDFEGYNTAADPPAARIQSLDDTSFSGHMVFLTKLPGASANALAERMRISSTGEVSFQTLGSAGGTQLCRNATNQISNCSSSLRYKTNIAPFSSGLSFINQLRPITFDWKAGGSRDIGFGAEEVAKINPLFVTYNAKGEVEGVKYDRLSVTFVNAFREQQTLIERQHKQIENQQQQIDALKKLVCDSHPEAAICKEGKGEKQK